MPSTSWRSAVESVSGCCNSRSSSMARKKPAPPGSAADVAMVGSGATLPAGRGGAAGASIAGRRGAGECLVVVANHRARPAAWRGDVDSLAVLQRVSGRELDRAKVVQRQYAATAAAGRLLDPFRGRVGRCVLLCRL